MTVTFALAGFENGRLTICNRGRGEPEPPSPTAVGVPYSKAASDKTPVAYDRFGQLSFCKLASFEQSR